MKAKLFLMGFLSLLCLGMWAEHPKKRPRANCQAQNRTAKTRKVFDPSIRAEDINNCLYLTFQFLLENADITIQDKDGNKVVNEQQILIYEGRVIVIPQADSYPYSIEIVSPTIEIQGEIVLEN